MEWPYADDDRKPQTSGNAESSGRAACPMGSAGYDPTPRCVARLILPDADSVVLLELVQDRPIADSADHCGVAGTAFDEVFGADWVIERLTDRDIAEVDAQKFGIVWHEIGSGSRRKV